MPRPSLYKSNGHYSKQGELLTQEAREAMSPIFRKWRSMGYRTEEISFAMVCQATIIDFLETLSSDSKASKK